jgi:hypothetical protein
MTWDNITVFQFQQLAEVWAPGKENKDTDLDKMAKICAICFNMTEKEVDSLSTSEFDKLCKGLAFLEQPMNWGPVKYVEVNGKKYRTILDIRDVNNVRNVAFGRYVEAKQFGTAFTANLHTIAASMFQPMFKTWYGTWKDAPYDSARHGEYAEDLREAPITAIHGSVGFFLRVYGYSIEVLADSLTEALPKEKRMEARQALIDSVNLLGGSTQRPLSLNMNGSHLARRLKSRLYKPSTTSPTSKQEGKKIKNS